MDIDRCNSVFELFAAFNFTYAVLSQPDRKKDVLSEDGHEKSFVNTVDEYIIKPYSKLKASSQSLDNRIDLLKKSLTGRLTENNLSDDGKGKVNDLLRKTLNQEEFLEAWNSDADISKDRARHDLNNRFPYISFLLAIFCVSVLILSASESHHKHFLLLVIDVLLGLEILFFFRFSKEILSILTYRNLLYTFVGILFFDLGINYFFHYYAIDNLKSVYAICQNMVDDKYRKPFFILFNMVIPFSHFFYYSLRFWIKIRFIDSASTKQLDFIEKRIKEVEEADKALINAQIFKS